MSEIRDPENREKRKGRGFSRRGFMQGIGVSGAVAPALLPEQAQAQTPPGVMGPGAVAITLNINGKPVKATVEPRETLLDTLRNHLDMTGAKRVCDRGTCGACSVLVNGKVSYACSILAIDAQGKQITTIEGFAMSGGKPHAVVQAFVNNDAQQCGYCTPGFVVASKAFLDHNPNPTYEQVKDGLGGNLCRCGTYVGVRKAVLEAAKMMKGGSRA
ncbi:(2Fe-2S)-binding protein [uncultured Paludibaculum sp.]|uniref:(2Fe-2S)-binding protein n=1 Tax=uncultured Paludibaculum sp. TaxID=1765020 RepID=UPI002AAC13A4|nr:(2Fe-2S)-binding protein [uncultured Paludibaculum sp.]